MFYTVLTIDYLVFHNIELILFFYLFLVSIRSLQRTRARSIKDVWLRIVSCLAVLSGKVQTIKMHSILISTRLTMETL
jgi:hypothetical protein